jgi:hypothetical protein
MLNDIYKRDEGLYSMTCPALQQAYDKRKAEQEEGQKKSKKN